MFAPRGYTLEKALHDGACEIVAALGEIDGRPVALKRRKDDRTPSGGSRARLELVTLRVAAGPHVIEALDVAETEEGPVLVLERVAGETLERLVGAGGMAVDEFLEVALQCARGLRCVHAAHVLHCSVSPDHVVVDPVKRTVHLVGFGLARAFGGAWVEPGRRRRSRLFAGLPRYVAPEQSGRMGRGIDARSDLYALGATLYYALTGEPPFLEDRVLSLIHAHMARMPVPLLERRPELPSTLARIVDKLLRKEPDDRYQTADALVADLDECQRQLAASGRIDDGLPIGTRDPPRAPLFASREFGREAERATLCDAYLRAADGAREAALVLGESGFGKSTLVDAIRPLLPRTRGYLASGKFDAYRRGPYAGILSSLESLVAQLLIERDERVAYWRDLVARELGPVLSAVLVEHVPDLGSLTGDLPPAPAQPPAESRMRLALAVRRFLACCAKPEHPLAIFLDDIQWADASGLEVIEDLLSHADSSHLLVVLAARTENAGARQEVIDLVERVEERGQPVARIPLGSLPPDAVASMVAAALERPVSHVAELARCVERKTGGNPLLVQQFVLRMHTLGWIRRDGSAWVWDAAEIERAEIPEGAVGLLVAKLEGLPDSAREHLLLASCVGYEFDASALEPVARCDRSVLETSLQLVSNQGLIAPSAHGFRFVHDRVREAALAMVSEDVRARLHYALARHAVESASELPRTDEIFEMAEHFVIGHAHVEESVRIRAVEVHLAAALRALAAGAAPAAATYLGAGRELFRACDWAEHGRLGFDLFIESAEAAFQSGELESALALVDELGERDYTGIDAVRIVCKRIQLYLVCRSAGDAVRYSLRELAARGVPWPLEPSRLRCWWAVKRVGRLLRARTGGELLEPAAELDLDRLARILIIDQAGAAMAITNVRFATLASCYVLGDYLRHGYIAQPAFTLAAYALFSFITTRDAKKSRELGRHALDWNERLPDPVWGPRVEFQIHGLLEPFVAHRSGVAEPTAALAERMAETGDAEFAYYARFTSCMSAALAGRAVADARRDFRRAIRAAPVRDERYRSLRTIDGLYALLDTPDPDEAALDALGVETIADGRDPDAHEPEVWTVALLVLCVYGRFERAFELAESRQRRLFQLAPFYYVADQTLYRGLAAAELACRARGRERRRYLRALADCERLLRAWSRSGPDFGHMATWISAERSRLRGRRESTRRGYERAAHRAGEIGFVHHAALARERHAAALADMLRETEAERVLDQARSDYTRWGALAKASRLGRGEG